jgi:7,8-dihydropterin-6-yl-methyl-4-(beta-D-ribofuranosyl)aminobenzene 5'-phosphate synthase
MVALLLTAANVRQSTGHDLRITVIYDNYPCVEGLDTDWGFSALIEYGEDCLLFDTGTQGQLLLSNAAKLELDLSRIDKVVLSHFHGDHTGGLPAFMEQLDEDVRPTVYSLPSYPRSFKREVAERGTSVDSEPFQEIIPGVYTTGQIRGPVNEQALAITTGKGLVVVTGCAHPGIVKIVETAKEHFETEVYHVIGGFHLGGTPTEALHNIIQDFRRLGVQKVTPTHCTGDEAIALFRAEYGEDYFPAGAGRVITIPEG